jgi:uncharacterized protein
MSTNKRPHGDYRRITTIFRVCLLSAVLCALLLPVLKAEEATGKSMFLLVYRPGPAWIAGKPQSQQRLKEHFNYILDIYAQREVKLAGGFTDEAAGGAVVLVVDNEARANELARNDPAVKEGVFLYELRPWHPVDWELQLRRRNEKRTDK